MYTAMRPITFTALLLSGLLVTCVRDLGAQPAPNAGTVLQLIHTAEGEMRQGDLSAAEISFQRAVDMSPDLSDGYFGLGLVQLRENKLEDAIRALTRASDLNPQLPGAHMFLGIAEYQRGRGEPAAAALRAEIALQPQNVEALTWLGIVELGLGRPEDAIEPLDQASTLAPKDANVLYYKARAHSQVAESAYQQLYKLDPDSVMVHRALGDTLAASGQPEKAIAEYEAALQKQPGNPDLYELLGEQDQKMGRADAAMNAYQQELKLNPQSAIALYNLGMIRVKRGEATEGVPMLRQAAEAHAAAAPTDFYLGLGLAELGQSAEAAHWLELSVANSPSSFIEQSAYYQLARVYQKLNRRADEQRALEHLKQLKEESAKTITGGAGPPANRPQAAAPPDGSLAPPPLPDAPSAPQKQP